MRKERILAVIMSVLLALSMIPATVFAAEIPALDGKLKIQGTAAEGRTLSAEFKEVKPEGVTEDDVAYLWERKTVEDEETEKAGEKPELKELGKDKTYTVTQDDIGSKIVLTVTGKEENGYTGSLKVVSDTVIDAQTAAGQEVKAAEEKAAAEAAKEAASSNSSGSSSQAVSSDSGISVSVDDVTLLSAIIYCEAGGEPYEGQLAVGAVVMNRLRSGAYPSSISGVIYQSGQFPPAGQGMVASIAANGPKSSCVQAAQQALGGSDNTGGATCFSRASSGRAGVVIGNHVFY